MGRAGRAGGWGWFCIIEEPGKDGGEGALSRAEQARHLSVFHTGSQGQVTESQQVNQGSDGPVALGHQQAGSAATRTVEPGTLHTAGGILAGLASTCRGACWPSICGVSGECDQRVTAACMYYLGETCVWVCERASIQASQVKENETHSGRGPVTGPRKVGAGKGVQGEGKGSGFGNLAY